MKLFKIRKHALISLFFLGTLIVLLTSVGNVHATTVTLIKEHHPASLFRDPSNTTDAYTIGQTITFHIHLNVTTSTDPLPWLSIEDLSIVDTLPNLAVPGPLYMTYVSGSQNSSSDQGAATFTDFGNGTLLWNFGHGPFTTGVLAPPPFGIPTEFYMASITFNATINSNVPDATFLTNTGVAHYTETASQVHSNPSISDNIWVSAPVLNIVKVNPVKVDNGSSFNYVLQLSNTGHEDAPGVVVQDIMPTGITHNTPATATSGSFIKDTSTNVTWTGTLFNVTNPGNTVNITIPVTANTPLTSVFNTASFIAYPAGVVFTHQSANCTTLILHPALTLTKDPNAVKVESGSSVSYTYTVTNTGDTSLTVGLSDNVFGTIFTGKVMAPGASNTTVISEMLTANITNTATAVGVDQTGASAQATATATVRVVHPAISLTKTPNPSEVQTAPANFTYTYVVTNTGDVALTGVTVYDQTFNTRILGPVALSIGQSATGTYGPVTFPNATVFTNYANATGIDQTGAVVHAFAQATITVGTPPTGGSLQPINKMMFLFATIQDMLVSYYWAAVPTIGAIAALIVFKKRRK